MTLVEDCSDKNLYLQYLHNYLHYIHKGKSKHVHHLCVRDVSFVIDGLLVPYTWHKIGVKCFIKFFSLY